MYQICLVNCYIAEPCASCMVFFLCVSGYFACILSTPSPTPINCSICVDPTWEEVLQIKVL